MAKWSFKQVLQFLAIPLAMTGFVFVASQAGGFVLRKDQPPRIDSQLIPAGKNPRS